MKGMATVGRAQDLPKAAAQARIMLPAIKLRPNVTRPTSIVNELLPYIHGLKERCELLSGSPKRVRLLFGFEAADWLFLAGGIAFTAVVAAVVVF